MTAPTLIRLFLSLCLLLMGAQGHAKLAPTLAIDSADQRLELAPWLDIASPTWRALDQPVLAQGYVPHTLQLRLKIHNPGLAKRRILEISRANIGRIEVVSRDPSGQWLTRHAGANQLVPRGDVNGLGYSFDLDIPEGPSEVFIHLSSAYPLTTPIRLSSENALFTATQNSAGLYGASLGMLGGMLLGIMALRSARLTIPIRWIFSAMVLMVILRALADRGVLGYWWLDIPGSLHGLIQVSGSLLSIAHVMLSRQFVTQHKPLPTAWSHLLLFAITANLLWLLTTISQTLTVPLYWADVLRLLTISVILCLLWYAMQQKTPGSALYFAVMFFGLLGQLYNDAALQGWVRFLAEPYEVIIAWHLLAAPLLLHALEHTSPAHSSNRNRPSLTTHVKPHHNAKLEIQPARLPALRVLVVEDNTWVQQVLTGLLLKLGCQPQAVNDGAQALVALKTSPFDLVLMDCDLPGLDGISTAQLWRTEACQQTFASAADIPMVAITAHVSAAYEKQAREAGMHDFLHKPIDMRTLHELLLRWRPNAQR